MKRQPHFESDREQISLEGCEGGHNCNSNDTGRNGCGLMERNNVSLN